MFLPGIRGYNLFFFVPGCCHCNQAKSTGADFFHGQKNNEWLLNERIRLTGPQAFTPTTLNCGTEMINQKLPERRSLIMTFSLWRSNYFSHLSSRSFTHNSPVSQLRSWGWGPASRAWLTLAHKTAPEGQHMSSERKCWDVTIFSPLRWPAGPEIRHTQTCSEMYQFLSITVYFWENKKEDRVEHELNKSRSLQALGSVLCAKN